MHSYRSFEVVLQELNANIVGEAAMAVRSLIKAEQDSNKKVRELTSNNTKLEQKIAEMEETIDKLEINVTKQHNKKMNY